MASWDAVEVLCLRNEDKADNITCVGLDSRSSRRCLRDLARHNLEAAKLIYTKIPTIAHDEKLLKEQLKLLAERLLCPGNHCKQKDPWQTKECITYWKEQIDQLLEKGRLEQQALLSVSCELKPTTIEPVPLIKIKAERSPEMFVFGLQARRDSKQAEQMEYECSDVDSVISYETVTVKCNLLQQPSAVTNRVHLRKDMQESLRQQEMQAAQKAEEEQQRLQRARIMAEEEQRRLQQQRELLERQRQERLHQEERERQARDENELLRRELAATRQAQQALQAKLDQTKEACQAAEAEIQAIKDDALHELVKDALEEIEREDDGEDETPKAGPDDQRVVAEQQRDEMSEHDQSVDGQIILATKGRRRDRFTIRNLIPRSSNAGHYNSPTIDAVLTAPWPSPSGPLQGLNDDNVKAYLQQASRPRQKAFLKQLVAILVAGTPEEISRRHPAFAKVLNKLGAPKAASSISRVISRR